MCRRSTVAHLGLFGQNIKPVWGWHVYSFVCSTPDLAAEAESGDAAVPVAVVASAAAAPVQSGEGAPEDAAGGAAEGAPEAPAAPAGGPLLLHAGHGARQAERPEGRWLSTHQLRQRKPVSPHRLLCAHPLSVCLYSKPSY